jgi:hypothetical protein
MSLIPSTRSSGGLLLTLWTYSPTITGFFISLIFVVLVGWTTAQTITLAITDRLPRIWSGFINLKNKSTINLVVSITRYILAL